MNSIHIDVFVNRGVRDEINAISEMGSPWFFTIKAFALSKFDFKSLLLAVNHFFTN